MYFDTMQPYWSTDFTYTPAYGIKETIGLKQWYHGEWSIWFRAFPKGIFNQMLFLGDATNASSMTYAIGIWKQPLGPLRATHTRTNVRITDFYHIKNHKITHNWMMIDMLDLLRQDGQTPLAVSPLPQGRDFPPMAMEGLPAPLSSFVIVADTRASRQVVQTVLDLEWRGTSDSMDHWHDSMKWYGPVPFGQASSKAEYRQHFLIPLHSAFAQQSLVLDTFTCEGKFCAAHGTFSGIHVGPWLGQPASHKLLKLDFGMHWQIVDNQILESWAIFDIPKMFLTLGIDLLREDSSRLQSDDYRVILQ